MTRRVVLSLTALAVIGTGVGVASAATSDEPQATLSVPTHQLCVLFYRNNNPQPQHICVNW